MITIKNMKNKSFLLNCKFVKYFNKPLPLLIYISIIFSFSCSKINCRKNMKLNSSLKNTHSQKSEDNIKICLPSVFYRFWHTTTFSKFLNYEDRIHLKHVCKKINKILKDNYNFTLELQFYIELNSANHADIFFPTIYNDYQIEKILPEASRIKLTSIF